MEPAFLICGAAFLTALFGLDVARRGRRSLSIPIILMLSGLYAWLVDARLAPMLPFWGLVLALELTRWASSNPSSESAPGNTDDGNTRG